MGRQLQPKAQRWLYFTSNNLQNTIFINENTQHINTRVRNRANPFVRDMPKYLRTSKMSVHGYPADKSIFYCNLKLGLLKLQEETAGTSHADIDQDDVSLAGVLQDAVGRAVCLFHPVFTRRCWAIIHAFPIRQCPVEAVFASSNRLLGSM